MALEKNLTKRSRYTQPISQHVLKGLPLASVRVHPVSAHLEPWTGKTWDTYEEFQGVWMNMILVDMRVDAAENLNRHEPRSRMILVMFCT